MTLPVNSSCSSSNFLRSCLPAFLIVPYELLIQPSFQLEDAASLVNGFERTRPRAASAPRSPDQRFAQSSLHVPGPTFFVPAFLIVPYELASQSASAESKSGLDSGRLIRARQPAGIASRRMANFSSAQGQGGWWPPNQFRPLPAGRSELRQHLSYSQLKTHGLVIVCLSFEVWRPMPRKEPTSSLSPDPLRRADHEQTSPAPDLAPGRQSHRRDRRARREKLSKAILRRNPVVLNKKIAASPFIAPKLPKRLVPKLLRLADRQHAPQIHH